MRILGILVALLFAGCLELPADGPSARDDAWRPDPCDPNPAATRSRNAPLLGAFRGAPEQVAERFARAVGRDLPGRNDAMTYRETHAWGDRRDGFEIRYIEGDPFALRYTAAYLWPDERPDEGDDFLRRFLVHVGAPGDVVVDASEPRQGRYEQRFRGQAVASGGYDVTDGRHEYGWWSTFSTDPMHELARAEPSVTEREAEEVAVEAMRCILDRESRTERGGYRFDRVHRGPEPHFAVRNESLAYEVTIAYHDPHDGHCSGITRTVHVDAATKAVLGSGWLYCD